jgi:hypothetical protein
MDTNDHGALFSYRRFWQNMQLRQRTNEGKMILRRFAESSAPKNSDKPAEKP